MPKQQVAISVWRRISHGSLPFTPVSPALSDASIPFPTAHLTSICALLLHCVAVRAISLLYRLGMEPQGG